MEDVQNLIKDLFKDTVEEMLESEMDEHLGYDKKVSRGITVGTAATDTTKRQSAPNMAKLKSRFQETATGNLSFRLLDSIRRNPKMFKISKKWNMPIKDWGIIMGQLSIYFEDRLNQLKVS
jgi:transposase-like protein